MAILAGKDQSQKRDIIFLAPCAFVKNSHDPPTAISLLSAPEELGLALPAGVRGFVYTKFAQKKKLHRWRQLTLRPGMDEGDIGYGLKSDSALLVIFLNEHEGSIKLFFFFFFLCFYPFGSLPLPSLSLPLPAIC